MSAPQHHLPDDWFVALASGTLAEAESLLAATHLTYCPTCRDRLALAEVAAARALEAAGPVDLDPGGLDALLARLDEPEPEPAVPQTADPVLPWPVLRITGPLASLRWSWLAPGVRGVDLPVPTTGLPMRLVQMRAGVQMNHRHAGTESGVVLAGGWTDEYGTYGRGDATFCDPELQPVHHQRIHDDADCIALVLNEQRALMDNPLFTPIARMLFKI
ncbi:MAG: cupin domain-containing protein [Myxococcota bacterium]